MRRKLPTPATHARECQPWYALAGAGIGRRGRADRLAVGGLQQGVRQVQPVRPGPRALAADRNLKTVGGQQEAQFCAALSV